TAAELLNRDGALLTRSHLAELGLTRTMVDAVFRELDVVVFPGSSRPAVKREAYLRLVEQSTYRDDRGRPAGRGATAAPAGSDGAETPDPRPGIAGREPTPLATRPPESDESDYDSDC